MEQIEDIHALVLLCVKHAVRPLRLLELADAISVSEPLIAGSNPATSKETIRAACTYPLHVAHDEVVELVESPVADDAESTARAHLRLARICASHLALGYLEETQPAHKFDFGSSARLRQVTITEQPFSPYSIDHCLDHVERAVSGLQHSELEALYAELDRALAVPNVVAALFVSRQRRKEKDITNATRRNAVQSQRRQPRTPRNREQSDYLRDGLKTPLELATCLGLIDYTKRILKASKPELPKGLFSHVCEVGNADMVRLLLAHGASFEDRDKTGYGPLHYAVKGNHARVFSILMDAGADILAKSTVSQRIMSFDHFPVTPLGAAGNVDAAMATQMLNHIDKPKHRSQLFIRAVKAGNIEGVTAMLQDSRVDINAHNDPDHQSRTPLYHACAARDAQMIALLLEAGASTKPPSGESTWDDDKVSCWPKPIPLVYIPPLHAYAHSDDLIQHPWKEVQFHLKSHRPKPFDQDSFNLLLTNGASVQQRDSRQNTALHHACDPDVVRHLIAARVDYNALNDEGRSFFCAPTDHSRHGLGELNTEPVLVCLELVGNQVDLSIQNPKNGRTPMLSWLACGKFKVALRMLDLGADATATDADGNGAFHLALKNPPTPRDDANRGSKRRFDLGGHGATADEDGNGKDDSDRFQTKNQPKFRTLAQALISKGADVNHANKEEQTPLHMVTRRRSSFASEDVGILLGVLVEAGAEIDGTDARGRTPLFQLVMEQSGKEAVQAMIRAGAQINVIDLEGTPLMFGSVRSPNVLRYLVGFGGDPHALDAAGNTLWHEAVLQRSHVKISFTELRSLGLDPEKKNKAGQTPLHFASWVAERRLGSERGPVLTDTTLEDLLKEGVNLDVADDDGITPLHVAIVKHEYAVKMLLSAGADPLKVTNDGVTTIQIAAAFIEGNTLGMLLQHIKRSEGDDFLVEFVNKKNALGRTALYYACASGRLETVETLVDAGAIVRSKDFGGSCWDGCAMFVGPQHHAYRSTVDMWSEGKFSTWGFKAQNLRSKHSMDPDLFRLDDIVPVLLSHDPNSPHLGEAMERAGSRGDGYVLECLLLDVEDHALNDEMRNALQERHDYVVTKPEPCCDKHNRTLFDLVRKKNHTGLNKWAGEQDLLLLDHTSYEERVFHWLARSGNWTLLKNITSITPGILSQLELKIAASPPTKENQSLLALACESTLPNMGTVRFLVQDLKTGFKISKETAHMSHCMTAAVHSCIEKGHWWQLYEALPHLIEHGADINALDQKGKPALFEHFKRYANHDIAGLTHLLELGYDPNIPNRDQLNTPGFTLLSSCGNNVELVKLLMDHGAVATQADFNMAIRHDDLFLLRAMIANGADPNTRYQRAEMHDYMVKMRQYHRDEGKGEGHIGAYDMFPLHYAASAQSRRSEEVVRILLESGADPRLRYENQSMMHAILRSGKCSEQVLDAKALNLEDRDFEGATLLLVACRYASTDIVYKILGLGADIRARDNRGRNALHFAQGHLELAKRIATDAPELINQQDQQGKTLLHLALGGDRLETSLSREPSVRDELALYLLDEGADAHIQCHNGDTALHILFGSSWEFADGEIWLADHRQNLLECLLKAGLDVNATNAMGQTPVFRFFGSRNNQKRRFNRMPSDGSREVKLLSEFANLGVDFKAVDNEGKTLLHIVAGTKGDWRLLRYKFLIRKGVNPKTEDARNQTSLDIAAMVGAEDILEWYQTQTQGHEGASGKSEWVLV